MNLNLDELVLLSEASDSYDKKSDLIYNTQKKLKNSTYTVLSDRIDGLVTRGLLEHKTGQYKITHDGEKTLKSEYSALQILMLHLHLRVNN